MGYGFGRDACLRQFLHRMEAERRDVIERSIKVRTGRPSDIDGLMHIALMACEENAVTAADPHKLLRDIWPALNLDHGIVGIIGDDPIEAAILLKTEPFWYAPDDQLCLLERAIFVHPEYRSAKGGRARLLCEWAKNASKELEMPLIIGVLSSERTEAKMRLYMRQFGEPAGMYFIYGARTGSAGKMA